MRYLRSPGRGQAIGNLAQCMLYGNPGFTQGALAQWLGRGLAEPGEMKAAYRCRRDLVYRRLAGVTGLRVHKPAAGMFVMIDVRATGLGAEAFAWRLLERSKVAVLAADTFGPSAAGHVRITFAVAEAKLAKACDRIAEFVEEVGRG